MCACKYILSEAYEGRVLITKHYGFLAFVIHPPGCMELYDHFPNFTNTYKRHKPNSQSKTKKPETVKPQSNNPTIQT